MAGVLVVVEGDADVVNKDNEPTRGHRGLNLPVNYPYSGPDLVLKAFKL